MSRTFFSFVNLQKSFLVFKKANKLDEKVMFG